MDRLIRFVLGNRLLVLTLAVLVSGAGNFPNAACQMGAAPGAIAVPELANRAPDRYGISNLSRSTNLRLSSRIADFFGNREKSSGDSLTSSVEEGALSFVFNTEQTPSPIRHCTSKVQTAAVSGYCQARDH